MLKGRVSIDDNLGEVEEIGSTKECNVIFKSAKVFLSMIQKLMKWDIKLIKIYGWADLKNIKTT